MVVPGGCFRCFCGVLTPVWVFQPTAPYLIHLRTPNLEPTADRASAWASPAATREAAPPVRPRPVLLDDRADMVPSCPAIDQVCVEAAKQN